MTDTITIGRCRDCRWWKQNLNMGHCQNDAPKDLAPTLAWTYPDFGCVAFERRGVAG